MFLRELVWSLRGGSDSCQTVSNLWYLLGWLVDQGGVVNKKKVPYIAGDMLSVLEIKLHQRSLLCSVTVGPNRLVHFP